MCPDTGGEFTKRSSSADEGYAAKAAYWAAHPGRFALGPVHLAASYAAREAAMQTPTPPDYSYFQRDTWNPSRLREEKVQTTLLRDLFDDLFQSTDLEAACLRWDGGLVLNMAEVIYRQRAFDQLPILADALEEAGCANTAILDHCHSAAAHTRGCWVLDRLLSYE